MVTIDPNRPISTNSGGKNIEPTEKTKKNEFTDIFNQALGPTTTEPTETQSIPFASEIRPSQFESAGKPSTTLIVDQVQHLIDTMETYQRKLIENGATLKSIEPFVNEMSDQNETLVASLKTIGDTDELNTIVNHSLMLSSAEIARFRSGFYVDR